MCGHYAHLPVRLNDAAFWLENCFYFVICKCSFVFLEAVIYFIVFYCLGCFFEVNKTSLLGIALVSLDQTSCPQP